MKEIVYRFGFPRIYRLILYCSLIAILGLIIYLIGEKNNLSDTDDQNDDYTIIEEKEFEDIFYLATD